MNDIKKLREMTGAGLADCKKALAESDDMTVLLHTCARRVRLLLLSVATARLLRVACS